MIHNDVELLSSEVQSLHLPEFSSFENTCDNLQIGGNHH